jgi:hypothetical protein
MSDLIRAAAYQAAQTRNDLRGPRATRTGKTKKVVCNPPNKKCGGRCIPPNWDCRLEGKGTNSELAVHRNDPLAGAASIQRGVVNIREGIKQGDLARIQRGRSAVIRGVVKAAPGDNLEEKKRLRRKLTERTSTVAAVVGVTTFGFFLHGQLKRNFPGSYGRGIGRDIDEAAGRGMDAVLDRTPLIAGRRAATRAAGAAAGAALTRAERFRDISLQRQAASLSRDNPQRLARVGTQATPVPEGAGLGNPPGRRFSTEGLRTATGGSLFQEFNRIDRTADSYDNWVQRRSSVMLGARSHTGNHSAYSEDAANQFLTSQFGLTSDLGRRPVPGRTPLTETGGITAGLPSIRKQTVIDGVANRLQTMRNDLEADMRLRRYTTREGGLDVRRYVDEIALPRARQQMRTNGTTLPRMQQREFESRVRNQFRDLLSGTNDLKTVQSKANAIYGSTVSNYDTYFRSASQLAERNAGSPGGTATGARMAMARQLTQTAEMPRGRRIMDPGHADFVLRDHFHRRVRGQTTSWLTSEDSARRVAQSLAGRSDRIPTTEVERILLANGINATTRSSAPRAGNPTVPARQLRSVNDIARRIMEAEGLSWEAAFRRAQREASQRGDAADPAVREDFRRSKGTGKKCGDSYIPRTHECHNGKAELKPAVKTAAKVALAAGIATGAAVLIDKKFKVREFHTGAKDLGMGQEGAPRGRRAGWEMKNKKPETPDVLIAKLGGLEKQKGVIPENVQRVRDIIAKENIHNDPAKLLKDFTPQAEELIRKTSSVKEERVGVYARASTAVVGGMMRLGVFGGMATAGSNAIYVKTYAPDANNHKPNPADVVSSAGRFMDLKSDTSAPSSSFKENLDKYFRNHSVSNNSLDGNSRDTMILIHEVAHKAHMRASGAKQGRPYKANDPFWDPDPNEVAAHMRKTGIKISYATADLTLTKFLSTYGASDVNESNPGKRRAETFAELSVLYATQGERFRREDPYGYAWTDLIWSAANS